MLGAAPYAPRQARYCRLARFFGRRGCGRVDEKGPAVVVCQHTAARRFLRNAPVEGGARMRSGNLRYAVLALIAARSEGVHGYRLKRDFQALHDDFWELNYGRLYRLLDQLERAGELDVVREVQDGRPNRKVYRITAKGEQTLDDWLMQPVSEDPKPLRDELSLKLLFIDERNTDAMFELIRQQRSIYLKKLARIGRRRRRLEKAGVNMKLVSLVLDGAEMRVEADLAWLDHLERRILHTF
ncbi:MAG: PadR family transcriptional regulator [Candidatus Dadabacteria bacterium]|nr:MAG: PadR family transcriptional regulator [Candidatus Dadabacteria bacterium]